MWLVLAKMSAFIWQWPLAFSMERLGPISNLQDVKYNVLFELCFDAPEVCSAANWTRRSAGVAQEDRGEKGAEGALEDPEGMAR